MARKSRFPENMAKVLKNIQVLEMIVGPKEPFAGNGWQVPEKSTSRNERVSEGVNFPKNMAKVTTNI